jgi:uncharacterized protein
VIRRLLLVVALLALASPAAAQKFPPLTGRVVDTADLLPPADEAAIAQQLEGLERTTSRQLVVVTVPDLQGYPIDDYGYKLGRAWGIGQGKLNNGVVLLIAKNDRQMTIEVGYGLEPVVTDSIADEIIRDQITPLFKQNDYPGGIKAGVDALVGQLQASPEEAEKRAAAAGAQQKERQQRQHRSGSLFPLIFWGIIMAVFFIGRIGRRGGRRYSRSGLPLVLWGPGWGGGSGGSSWGGGGGGGWGGGGGFSGGGGSFGGGGASGSW